MLHLAKNVLKQIFVINLVFYAKNITDIEI